MKALLILAALVEPAALLLSTDYLRCETDLRLITVDGSIEAEVTCNKRVSGSLAYDQIRRAMGKRGITNFLVTYPVAVGSELNEMWIFRVILY